MKQYNKSIKGKLFKYFEQRLNIKSSTKGWWRADCPMCGGKFTLGIHLSYSRVHCFKCGEAMSPVQLLTELEHFNESREAYKFLSIQQEYDYYETRISKREYKQVELPEGYRLINQGDSLLAKSARNYLKKRRFNIESLALKGVGYGTEGLYFGYIIFPYYVKGELVYYQGRRFAGAGPKMINPREEEFGIGKSQVLYNGDALYIYKRIYLSESITNSLTMGEAGVGQNGKSISDSQFSQILNSPCEQVIILLDPDAWEEAIKLGLRLVHYKKVKVVRMPEEKDVNDIGKKETIKIVKSTRFQSYMDLFREKLKLNETDSKHTYNRGPFTRDRT